MDEKFSTNSGISILPKLVEAGLNGNRQRIELLALNAIRSLKIEQPAIANEIGAALVKYSAVGGFTRGASFEPPPADSDGGMSLVRPQAVEGIQAPIFPDIIRETIERFVRERELSDTLLRAGLQPPRSVLLKGPPGTGKTTLAKHIADRLGLRLMALDLATAVSSYLGKTGSNLRRSFDYARAAPCVLLLDEFDAIAKRRDDNTEIGELKRIVNVLLKELEEWPAHSVIIAATNHPELLDPAINRRFDLVMDIPLPSPGEREAILIRSLGALAKALPNGLISVMGKALDGRSGADLEALVHAASRRHVIEGGDLTSILIGELSGRMPAELGKKELGNLIQGLHSSSNMSVREMATLLGKGPSTIQYHLKKKERKNV